jgi:hypothetical protein
MISLKSIFLVTALYMRDQFDLGQLTIKSVFTNIFMPNSAYPSASRGNRAHCINGSSYVNIQLQWTNATFPPNL